MSVLNWIILGLIGVALIVALIFPKLRMWLMAAVAALGFFFGMLINRNKAYKEVSKKSKERQKHAKQLEEDNKTALKQKIKEYESMSVKEVIDRFKRRKG